MLNDVFEAEKAVHLSADFGGSTHTYTHRRCDVRAKSVRTLLSGMGGRASGAAVPFERRARNILDNRAERRAAAWLAGGLQG